MNLVEIAKMRLINQQIETPKFTAAKELVGWMGALQAQDYGMAKWAIGLRLPTATDKVIESGHKQRGDHPDAFITAHLAFRFGR